MPDEENSVAFTIDTKTEFGQRVERRLRDEQVIWLVTVRPNGQPEPSPVWFLWDGATFLIYSQPNTVKVKDIAADPRVALHLNSAPSGEDVVILTGEAREDRSAPPVDQNPVYLAKYRQGIQSIGTTPEGMARDFSLPLRITPTKLRGF
jgi:PPOX class probable F420-dependent enzyme